MAGVGNIGLPPRLLRQGMNDMARISDAHISGTTCGAVVLHVAPEAVAGGPLAAVPNGTESSSLTRAAACTWTSATKNSSAG